MARTKGFWTRGGRSWWVVGAVAVGSAAFVVAASADPTTPPSATTAPTISGTAGLGSTLTADDGIWDNEPTGITRQWQRCTDATTCADIAGATGPTYAPGFADFNRWLRLKVTATNVVGSSTAVTAQTAKVNGGVTCPGANPVLWDGGAGTELWSTAANWLPDGVPGTTADVCLVPDAPGASVRTSGTVSVRSVRVLKPLTIAGNFTVAASTEYMTNVLTQTTWSSGVLTGSYVAANAGSGGLVLTTTGTHTLGIGSTIGVVNATGVGTPSIGDDLRIDPSATLLMSCNSKIDVSGRVAIATTVASTVISPTGSGTPCTRQIWPALGGSIVRTGATGAATITVPIKNALGGLIDGGTAGIRLTSTLDYPSTTATTAGSFAGKVEFGGSIALGPTSVLRGTPTVVSGTVVGSAYVDSDSTFSITGGTLSASVTGPGKLSIEGGTVGSTIEGGGTREWVSGALNGATIVGGAELRALSGSIASPVHSVSGNTSIALGGRLTILDAKTVRIACSAVLTNQGIITVQGTNARPIDRYTSSNCGGTLNNDFGGMITTAMSDPATKSQMSLVAFENHGTIGGGSNPIVLGNATLPTSATATSGGRFETGVEFAGNVTLAPTSRVVGQVTHTAGTLAGHLVIESGAGVITSGASSVLSATVSGEGGYVLAGGTLSGVVEGPGTRAWLAGTLNGMTVGADVDFGAAGVGPHLVTGNATVVGSATLRITGVTVRMTCTGDLIAHGRILIDGPTVTAGAGAIDRPVSSSCLGTVRVQHGGRLTTTNTASNAESKVTAYFTNHGEIGGGTGSLRMTVTSGFPATDATTSGDFLSGVVLAGGVAFDPTSRIKGDVVQDAGEVAGTATITGTGTLTSQGGSVTGAITGPGEFRLKGGTMKSGFDDDGPRIWESGVVDGAQVLDDAVLRVVESTLHSLAGLTVQPGGTMRLEGPAWIRFGCARQLVNNGTIQFAGTSTQPLQRGDSYGCTMGELHNSGVVETTAETPPTYVNLEVNYTNHGLFDGGNSTLQLRSTVGYPNLAATTDGDFENVHLTSSTALDPSTRMYGVSLTGGTIIGGTTVSDSATLTTSSGTVDARIDGPGTYTLTGGSLRSVVTKGGDRFWKSGTLNGATIEKDALLQAIGPYSNHEVLSIVTIADDAKLTISDDGAIDLNCSSILNNLGTIEIIGVNTEPLWFDRPYGQTCTSTLVNGPTGLLTKSGSTAGSYINIPFYENHGVIDGGSGLISLKGTAGYPGTAATDGGHYAGRIQLSGNVALSPTSSFDAGATALHMSGFLTGEVHGPGTLKMSGTSTGLAIHPGSTMEDPERPGYTIDRSRVLYNGVIEGVVTVVGGATLTVERVPTVKPNAELRDLGAVVWLGDAGSWNCVSCLFHIADGGVLELRRNTLGSVKQAFTFLGGTFDNNGLVRLTGELPGVLMTFPPVATILSYGEITIEATLPSWAGDIVDRVNNVAAMSPDRPAQAALSTLGNLVASAALEAFLGGDVSVLTSACADGSAGAAIFQVRVSSCNVASTFGEQAMTTTVGAAIGVPSATPYISGGASTNLMWGVGLGRPVTADDAGGLDICSDIGVELEVVEVSGQYCFSPVGQGPTSSPVPIPLEPLLYPSMSTILSLPGVHAFGIGASVSTPAVNGIPISASIGLNYTHVTPCGSWFTIFSRNCPEPPTITQSIQPTTMQTPTNSKMIDVVGRGFGVSPGYFKATLVRDTETGVATYNLTVDSRTDSFVRLKLPTSGLPVGVYRLVIATSTGNTELRTEAEDRVLMVVAPPPGN